MLTTITGLLALGAFGTSIASLAERCPAGVPCLLLSIAALLAFVPVGP